MRARFLAALSIFAGGLAYGVLPRGAFGTYDIASRAALTGAVARRVVPACLDADQTMEAFTKLKGTSLSGAV